jgi:hypothetical protein
LKIVTLERPKILARPTGLKLLGMLVFSAAGGGCLGSGSATAIFANLIDAEVPQSLATQEESAPPALDPEPTSGQQQQQQQQQQQ